MILNRNLNLSSVKVKQKYYLSVLSKKKKKPTDRPNPKTMGRVTANKLFIKDGLSQSIFVARLHVRIEIVLSVWKPNIL